MSQSCGHCGPPNTSSSHYEIGAACGCGSMSLRHGLLPLPDKAVRSLVSGPLQLQRHVLEFDLCVAGGGVVVAAHVHVIHDSAAPQARVHQRLAHQPVCEVSCSGYLQRAPGLLQCLGSGRALAYLRGSMLGLCLSHHAAAPCNS